MVYRIAGYSSVSCPFLLWILHYKKSGISSVDLVALSISGWNGNKIHMLKIKGRNIFFPGIFFFLDKCFNRLPSVWESGWYHLLARLNLSRALGKYHRFLCLHLVQIPNRTRPLFWAQIIVRYQTCLNFNTRRIKFLWIALKTWQLIKRCMLTGMAQLYHIFLFSWRWEVWSETSL